jgi:MinD superfamily P-loop ATPase
MTFHHEIVTGRLVYCGKPTEHPYLNGWFCPKCQRLTEHIIVYRNYPSKHQEHKKKRCIQCLICGETTPLKAITYFTEKVGSRHGSTFKNSGHYYGNGHLGRPHGV